MGMEKNIRDERNVRWLCEKIAEAIFAKKYMKKRGF